MKKVLLVLAALLSFGSLAAAGDWPNWRGPNQNGVAVGKTYPTKWSKTENVAWKIELPGLGSSTPAVQGDFIFVTTGVGGKNTLLCYDRAGNELWRNEELGKETAGKHAKASGSNSSPLAAANHVYTYFKSGDLSCVDLKGKLVWQHNLQKKFGEDTLWWDLGTSPVATKKNIVVAVMQTGPSYLVAFDKLTGDVAWKQDRNLDAPEEAAQSYSTPVVFDEGDKEFMVVLGADHVTGHDAANGKEIWRVGGLNPGQNKYFRSIASPVAGQGMVVAPYGRSGGQVYGIRLGGSGDVTSTHLAWTMESGGPDVPTPTLGEGRTYICGDKGQVFCLDLKTGKEIWTGQVAKGRKDYSASPIAAGGHLYITREDGKVFVIELGDKFKVVADNDLDGELTVATPVFVDGKILIRTDKHLYCIGK